LTKLPKIDETPLMKQYFAIKAKYPDALLLFRVGDFYETFSEDAIKTSQILGIVLTKRNNGTSYVELAGFPYHSLDIYLPKLVKAGQRVAICEQLEDPKLTKKIVKRGVIELVTPGTSTNDKILENKQNNYLAAVHFTEDKIGISFLDLSTGEFLVAEGEADYIENLISTFKPAEIIYSKSKQEIFNKIFPSRQYTFLLEEWLFTFDFAYEKLLKHFNTKNLKGFGVEEMKDAICAAGVILHYLSDNKYNELKHIVKISRIERDKYVWLDKFTIRNLELFHTNQYEGTPLISIIDNSLTPMGSRLLKKWLSLPLKDLKAIKERQDIVEFLYNNGDLKTRLDEITAQIGDLERLISKMALRKINPREVKHISKALAWITEIKAIVLATEEEHLIKLGEKLNPCLDIREKIDKTIVDDPPVQVNKGDLVRKGVSADLDELKELLGSGKDYLLKIREREIANTGINSLKIAYNSVFGYYLEVTNAHKEKVPNEWIRKQTLVNAERYITEELKEYEEKILTAEEKILELENSIYQDLLFEISNFIEPIQQNAILIGYLDCLSSFAKNAKNFNYSRPEIDKDLVIDIREGRHPVIEQRMPEGEEFIPNDVYLNNDNQQIIILTGPNMSGKSAILRQTALIVLLAQIGSFVPAKSARIGLVDKIFTRVGASDNLSMGESTFMVEMLETASILNNVSERSLILLDEIGRGTSTYDGVSIAWAITEFLHQTTLKPKTIFATHYHELNELAAGLKRVRNFNVSVKEYQNKVIFLRKLVPGSSEHSFGIHVAQMAGIPKTVVERSQEILDKLEDQRANIKNDQTMNKPDKLNIQLKLFEIDDPIYERVKTELNKIDVNAITPIEALMKLNHLKSLLKKDKS
jgi:DNA mismatch repair protein MutS